MTTRVLAYLAPLLLLAAPSVVAGGGSQTIRYVSDQAFLNMDGPFVAGDSGFLCYGIEGPRVGGCGYHFNVPTAPEGAAVQLVLQDQAPVPVTLEWSLVNEDDEACDAGEATGAAGLASASFEIVDDCRVVAFRLVGATAGTVSLVWSS